MRYRGEFGDWLILDFVVLVDFGCWLLVVGGGLTGNGLERFRSHFAATGGSGRGKETKEREREGEVEGGDHLGLILNIW